MEFKSLSDNFRTFDMTDIVVKIGASHGSELSDLNTSQLERGILSTGEKTPEYASESYEKLKRSIGSISGDNMDFKLEGDFYEGWSVENISDKWLEFDSSDEKTPRLERKGSSDIFGLTEPNKDEAASIIKQDDQLNKMVYERLTNG